MRQLQALQKQQLRKQEMQMVMNEQDMTSVAVQLTCRSIKTRPADGIPEVMQVDQVLPL